jgi:hypothetical protein
MTTKRKLITLELISGIFGWGWIIAGLVSLYFLVIAIGFEGSWSSFGMAAGVAAVCKWLAKGFNDNKIRVAFEADAIAQGMSAEEAGNAWLKAYNGKR